MSLTNIFNGIEFNQILQYLKNPQVLYSDLEILFDLYRTRKELKNLADMDVDEGKSKGIFAIVSFTSSPLYTKYLSLVAKIMQLNGYSPMVICLSNNYIAHKYYRMFGISNIVFWDRVLFGFSPLKREYKSIVNNLFPDELDVMYAKGIIYHHIQVGKHALSDTCRSRIEGRLDLKDPDTRQLFRFFLYKAVQGVMVAEQFFDKYAIQKLLIKDQGYSPYASIFEVGLRKGVDCVMLEIAQKRSAWVFKRYTPESILQHYFSLDPSTWQRVKQIPWTEEKESLVEEEFEGRYKSDSTDDTRRLQSGKMEKKAEDVRRQLGLDPAKKTAVIFSHIAWDAAFFYGESIFSDYEDWLFKTVQFVAKECPHINWLVKEHPFNILSSGMKR